MVAPANARAIATLCRGLEGIPLALELAGAKAQTLTAGEMARRLTERFELLATRRPGVPQRLRALRAATRSSSGACVL